jgi:hypothetical protein
MTQRASSTVLAIALALALAGCGGGGSGGGGGAAGAASALPPAPAATPSDDPADWIVDPTRVYDPVISAPFQVVPSPSLPPQVHDLPSNNNCALCFHDGRLFFAFRTGETHFASKNVRMYVLSSTDLGRTWTCEHEIALGADVREPTLISIGGHLVLHFFEGGTIPLAFEPKHIWQIERLGPGSWSAPRAVLAPGEVPWEVKVRGKTAFMTSYSGTTHYGAGRAAIDLHFWRSPDGLSWSPVDPSHPTLYTGGVSEVGWEFTETGDLFAVLRNEDGDTTGWGSMVATAPAADLGRWTFPPVSDPERYDSPRMFRHGRDLYLLARRDVNGPFDQGLRSLSFEEQRNTYLLWYSLRPKRTALYRIDEQQRRVVWLADLPSDGDTAFPAVARLDADTYLVANYTSPLGNPDRSWIHGQLSPEGTLIYFLTIRFVPR